MKKFFIFIFLQLFFYLTINSLTSGVQKVFKEVEMLNKIFKIEKSLDSIYSDKELGAICTVEKTIFRIFAPRAYIVELYLFNQPEESEYVAFELTKDEDGVWEIEINENLSKKFYAYRIFNSKKEYDNKNKKPFVVDPYAKAIATKTSYMNPRRGIIVMKENYDWEGTDWIALDWRDLIIYEAHVRDLTIHPSSGVKNRGQYIGLTEKGRIGGLDYIKSLGVNAVEFLPLQEFGVMEIPYKKEFAGRFNTWNPYERNHWGYMTAGFFAPAALYSEDMIEFKRDVWIGKSGNQITHFKDMVKAFHKERIAVIMDVVYNHFSEYELGGLKEIDFEYYFRLDDNGNFKSESGCGNDLKTERPMVRRLIIESLKYWMTEYKIDGFRFDLGKLIDWETVEAITLELKKINPNVIIVCEPWGGGYDPAGFSLRGWGAWNDQIRNGIKGENPFNGLGWIFGNWYWGNDFDRIISYLRGTLVLDKGGLFQKAEHSVNYLESHDGYTLGDFIRIASKEIDPQKRFNNSDEIIKLTPLQLQLHKLAAAFLFISKGIIMIHSGQEFARSKVIPLKNTFDPEAGHIDHNSYNKDDETNYINYDHAKINSDLFEYYQGLIKLRKTYEAFRRAEYKDYKFTKLEANEFAIKIEINYKGQLFIALFNSHPYLTAEFSLPAGLFDILVDNNKAGISSLGELKTKAFLQSRSVLILKRRIP